MTWYPPGESATVAALRLAAKLREPDLALKAARMELDRVAHYPEAAHQVRKTILILETWAEWENERLAKETPK